MVLLLEHLSYYLFPIFNVNYSSLFTDLGPLLSNNHKALKDPLEEISGADIIVVNLEFDGQVLPQQVCMWMIEKREFKFKIYLKWVIY